MSTSTTSASSRLADGFDAQGRWRRDVGERVDALSRVVQKHGLVDESARGALARLAERLHGDKLVVAFVAEFSRGKSELINAVFFGDAGRRVLPATPGRTTMCPVELGFDAALPPSVSLLPIATRHEGLSLAELRGQADRWTRIAIDPSRPETLPDALVEVTKTVPVGVDEARRLGFWDDARPDDNPPRGADGRVAVPAWRHALINHPHPLLRQGLVVIDTPGLNAVGAEPELTLALLPAAHATVFVLGADTGVTRSDLGVWRDHLGGRDASSRFVVLNKIDALADPLLSADQVAAQIAAQARASADSLHVPLARVFALSARQALTARLKRGDDGVHGARPDADHGDALRASGILRFEQALASELLPRRQAVLAESVASLLRRVEEQALRRLADERRLLAEQTIELRGLRGKNGGRVQQLLDRVASDAAALEQCSLRLRALRAVHGRMLKAALHSVSSDTLRQEVSRLQDELDGTLLKLGAGRAFTAMCGRLRARLGDARAQHDELREMLAVQYARLNAEHGFSLKPAPPGDWGRFAEELSLLEANYARFLGIGNALRLAQPSFREQFRRMLVSKLRVLFETAGGELEQWSRSAAAQLDAQLRDRRRGLRKRQETLLRIQSAAGELEQRIADIEAQDLRLVTMRERVAGLADAARRAALSGVPAEPEEPAGLEKDAEAVTAPALERSLA